MASAPAAIAVVPTAEILDRRLDVRQIQARRTAIQDLMKQTMREDVDFGTIPGTPKPTLYKPGAEKICSMFQLAPRISVHDMSSPDHIRYQVKVELYSASGIFCGEGVGTASSAETKYQWRRSVCDEEYDCTPEDRRRISYKSSKGGNGFYTIAQVRTEPDDADNTVLKMAKKRALVDAVLTVTAASDIFTQDVEPGDLPEGGYQDGDQLSQGQPQQQQQRPAARSTTAPRAATQQQQRPASGQGSRQRPNNPVSEAQVRRFHAIAGNAGKKADEVKAYLFAKYGSEHASDLDRSVYDDACVWAATKTAPNPAMAPSSAAAFHEDEELEPIDGDDDFDQR